MFPQYIHVEQQDISAIVLVAKQLGLVMLAKLFDNPGISRIVVAIEFLQNLHNFVGISLTKCRGHEVSSGIFADFWRKTMLGVNSYVEPPQTGQSF